MSSPRVSTPYQVIGGEKGVRDLVERFYGYMDSLPEAQPIRAMHPASLGSSVDKLFKFLSGWLGGPNLYEQEFGHPRLRMRHFPFAIGPAERDQWLLCMRRALDDLQLPADFDASLFAALTRTADHMINQE